MGANHVVRASNTTVRNLRPIAHQTRATSGPTKLWAGRVDLMTMVSIGGAPPPGVSLAEFRLY